MNFSPSSALWIGLRKRLSKEQTRRDVKLVVATSPVARGMGRLDVVPAFGRRCINNPGGILSKLSRIVVEGPDAGHGRTFGERVAQLVSTLEAALDYDVVLIDARAGLSEISAAPLLALGADVLLFMGDSSQSFLTYLRLTFPPAALLTDARRHSRGG